MSLVVEAYRSSARHLQNDVGLSREEAHVLARLLLDHLTGVRYAHLLQPQAVLSADAEQQLAQMLGDLGRGRPLPYILRRREFLDCTFRCDERALIPRPETEVLVEATIAQLEDRGQVLIADLGTGSGCIAVSVACALPDAIVYATDVSQDVLELARENAHQQEVAERVHFLRGDATDWAAPLLEAGCRQKFDAVLSNPPYIASAEIATLQTQIRDWEPHTALDGGVDGLDCYRRLASQCGTLLQADGFLMVELGAGQYDAVRAIFCSAGWSVAAPILDLAGIERVLVARRST